MTDSGHLLDTKVSCLRRQSQTIEDLPYKQTATLNFGTMLTRLAIQRASLPAAILSNVPALSLGLVERLSTKVRRV